MSWLARLPPSEVVPQPDTVQMCPEGYSWPEEGMAMVSITELLRSAAPSRWSIQMSLEMVHESYSSWLRTLDTAMSAWSGSSLYRLWLPTLTPSLLADWLWMKNYINRSMMTTDTYPSQQ